MIKTNLTSMYPMLLAQVWMHSINFPSKPFFCNFFEFPTTICTHSKFNNIVHILGFKTTNQIY
jgi:hypothetical protein